MLTTDRQSSFRRIAIINRGHGAQRFIQSVREFRQTTGIALETIALFTESDREARFAREADHAYDLGASTYVDSQGKRRSRYTDLSALADALHTTQADAIWVGWGYTPTFLALAELSERLQLTYVGADTACLPLLQDKVQVKDLARHLDIPTLPWIDPNDGEPQDFPVYVKARIGGGGIFHERVEDAETYARIVPVLGARARQELGDERLLIEPEVTGARLLSVQAMAGWDRQPVLLGTRDGSLQLHGRKILAEAPASGLSATLERRLYQWSHSLLSAAGFVGVASVEFLWDSTSDTVWFLEVNPRLESAFTLTEALTGIDLIKAQLRISLGLDLPQPDPVGRKRILEAHLRAEDPLQDYSPSAGILDLLQVPSGPGLHVETAARSGDQMKPGLSPSIAKLIAEGQDRREAYVRLGEALHHTRVVLRDGWTNLNVLTHLVLHPELQDQPQHADWVRLQNLHGPDAESETLAIFVAALECFRRDEALAIQSFRTQAAQGFPRLPHDPDRPYVLSGTHYRHDIRCRRLTEDRYRLLWELHQSIDICYQQVTRWERRLIFEARRCYEVAVTEEEGAYLVSLRGRQQRIFTQSESLVRAPSPGVVQHIYVQAGETIEQGTPILALEAMKLELTVRAPFSGVVRTIHCLPYSPVAREAPLLTMERRDVMPLYPDDPLIHRLVAEQQAARAQGASDDPSCRELFLGIERHPAVLRHLVTRWRERIDKLVGSLDPEDHREAQEWLGMYIDRQQLFARRAASPQARTYSPEEDLLVYLAQGSTRSLKDPEAFRCYATQAFRHYGVSFEERPSEAQWRVLYQLFLARQTEAWQQEIVTILLRACHRLLERGLARAFCSALQPLFGPLQRTLGSRALGLGDLAFALETLGDDPEIVSSIHDYRSVPSSCPQSLHQTLQSFVHDDVFTYSPVMGIGEVGLFRAQARSAVRDERAFVFVQVASDATEGWPELSQKFRRALYLLRCDQAGRSLPQRAHSNRIYIDLLQPLSWSPEQVMDFAETLSGSTEHAGIEKVVLRLRWKDDPLPHCFFLSRPHGLGLLMREIDGVSISPRLRSPYEERVLKLRQRGMIDPFELMLMYCPDERDRSRFPRGRFIEYDLQDGRLWPVDRPQGEQRAHLICGVVEHWTDRHPQGMKRVVLMGDPSRALGSLADAECQRIIAALDLAEALLVPVEWFALSSGAKIAMDSGTENMDSIAAALRRIVLFTQAGGEINVVVMGINVGAQPYFNAEATMLMHTRGVLIMMPQSAMVLTGKRALDYSGGISAEDEQGIGGYDRIMALNGQAQYFAADPAAACRLLLQHYDYTYRAGGQSLPPRLPTRDPYHRDITQAVHGDEFPTLADVWSPLGNGARKRPFHIRCILNAVIDNDRPPLERWRDMRDAEIAVCWDAQIGGFPVALIGIESEPIPRKSTPASDGPTDWTGGTLFPASSKKIARMINSASNNRPLVILANLSGFDGSPESMRNGQLEFGAEIGRAVVNFKGPILFCVVSRFHGGAYVVFSRTLNEQLEIVALEGTYASVIGGAPAAGVVFAGEVEARIKAHPEVEDLRSQLDQASDPERVRLQDELNSLIEQVRADTVRVLAEAYDKEHSVERALKVGSLHRIIRPAALRPSLIRSLEEHSCTHSPTAQS